MRKNNKPISLPVSRYGLYRKYDMKRRKNKHEKDGITNRNVTQMT